MQNSEIKGQRYLNDKTKKEDQRKKDRAEILIELQQIREEPIPRNGK
ncbi:MAG: hypothetical protein JST85_12070 [Acidobacteria bacterium]|nr:hypothetical protein [Acidobacteriota bacterium]